MKKLMSVALGLCLIVPLASFAQATGGSTDKSTKGGKIETGTKTKTKSHGKKGGKKGKKSSGGPTTQPPK